MTYLKVWTSFRESIAPLNDSEKGRLFDAMLLYAETGEEPSEFRGNERFLWAVAKQDIDRTAQKCEALRANGSKGGFAKSKNQQSLANDSKVCQTVANDSNGQQTEAKPGRKEKKCNEMKRKETDDLSDDDDEEEEITTLYHSTRARGDQWTSAAGKAIRLNFGRNATPAEIKQLAACARRFETAPLMLALAIGKAAEHGAKSLTSYVPHILQEWKDYEVWTPEDAEEYQELYDMEFGVNRTIDPIEAHRLQREQTARRKQAHEERLQEEADGQGAAGA